MVKLLIRRQGAGAVGGKAMFAGGGGNAEPQEDPRKLPAKVLAGHIPKGIGMCRGFMYGNSGG